MYINKILMCLSFTTIFKFPKLKFLETSIVRFFFFFLQVKKVKYLPHL